MGSINRLIGNANVDFNSLSGVFKGTYNMGEVVAKKGRSGITFDKVNNHVTRTGSNTVIRSADQNTQTNAAVFKAILAQFGGAASEEARNAILNTDISHVTDDLFNGFANPFIKEAFHFLLTDDLKGRPLSRDEMLLLNDLLERGQEGSRSFVGPEQVTGDYVKAGMGRLRDLHAFKTQISDGSLQVPSEFVNVRGAQNVRGLKVANHAATRKLLETTTVNQVGAKFQELELARMDGSAAAKAAAPKNAGGTFSRADLQTLKDIARIAMGHREGKAGGAGYMGFLNGKPVKFLTHAGERKGSIGGDLGEEEKKAIKDATDELRRTLLDLARKISEDMARRVGDLLKASGAGKDGLGPMLSRARVARAISEIADEAMDETGRYFNWTEITASDSVAKTGLKDVFGSSGQS